MTDRDPSTPTPRSSLASLRQLCARLLVVVAGVLSAGAAIDTRDPVDPSAGGKAADLAQLDEGENWL